MGELMSPADTLRLAAQTGQFDKTFAPTVTSVPDPTSVTSWNQRVARASLPPGQSVMSPEDQARLLGGQPMSQEDSDRLLGGDQTHRGLYDQYVKPSIDYVTQKASEIYNNRVRAIESAPPPSRVFGADQAAAFGSGFSEAFGDPSQIWSESIKAAWNDLDKQHAEPLKTGLKTVLAVSDLSARTAMGLGAGSLRAFFSTIPGLTDTDRQKLEQDVMLEVMRRGGEAHPSLATPDVAPTELGLKPPSVDVPGTKGAPSPETVADVVAATRAPEAPKPTSEPTTAPVKKPASPPAQSASAQGSPPESSPPVAGVTPVEAGPERIVTPAVLVNGKIYTGAYHPDALEKAATDTGIPFDKLTEQREGLDGFLTSTGRYVDRKEATKIMDASGEVADKGYTVDGRLSGESLPPWQDQHADSNLALIAQVDGKPLATKPQPPVSPEQLTAAMEKPEPVAPVEAAKPTAVPSSAFRADAERAYGRLTKKVKELPAFDELQTGWADSLGLKGAQKADADRINKWLQEKAGVETPKGQRRLVYANGKYTLQEAAIEGLRKVPETTEVLPPPDAFISRDNVDLRPAFEGVAKGIHAIQEKMGLPKSRITIGDFPERGWSKTNYRLNADGTKTVESHELLVNPKSHYSDWDLYGTMSHELGHLIMNDKLVKAPPHIQLAVEGAFQRFRERLATLPVARKSFAQMISMRDNIASIEHYIVEPEGKQIMLRDMAPENRDYYLSKSEWFAEQVAKWMTTDQKPIGIVDKFFSGIAKRLQGLHLFFAKKFGYTPTPTEAVQGFLDSLMKQNADAMRVAHENFVIKTTNANRRLARDIAPDFPVTEMTPASIPQRTMFREIYSEASKAPASVRAAPAIADKWYKRWSWWRGITQVADANLHIEPLQRYRDLNIRMHQFATDLHMKMEQRLNQLLKLNGGEREAFNRLTDEYMNMTYLTPAEKAAGVERRPTAVELQDMINGNSVNDRTARLFAQVVRDYDGHMAQVMAVARDQAQRDLAGDPAALASKLAALDAAQRQYLQKPYAPAMRYGDHGLQILDDTGAQVAFYRVESKREFNKLVKNWRAQARANGWDPNASVLPQKMPKSMAPFMNLPPHLMDLLEKRLGLDAEQMKIFQMLKNEVAPISSFAHRFQKKNLVPGYSTDFIRAYSHYFFHGGRYLARAKYMLEIERASFDLDKSIKAVGGDASFKRSQIANYVRDHLTEIKNPTADWSILNAAAFHYFIGPRVSAVAQNLTQSFTSTGPMLAAKFGDHIAAKEMAAAGLFWKNWWRDATIRNYNTPIARAIAEGIEGGELKGSLASTLASVSEGRTFVRTMGYTKTDKYWNNALKLSAKMFELSEQGNRHIAYVSAYTAAIKDNQARFVSEAVQALPKTYEDLITKGFAENEARAVTTAKWLTRITQGDYNAYARPALFRGRLGRTAFVFGTFKHQMLVNMWNFKDAGVRSLLTYGILGGAMGIPFAEDVKGIIKALAWQLFGKDFDIEREGRNYLQTVMGDPNSKDTMATYGPGIIMRGISQQGFGTPLIADAIGEWFGTTNLPAMATVDMSHSVGLGQYLPVDVGAAFGPTRDVNQAIAEQGSRAFGAWGSFLYNAINAGFGAGNDPWKRAESVAPAVFRDWSKAYRIASRGYETNSVGDKVATFDMSDPEQRAEVLAIALGFQPRRLTAQREVIRDKIEVARVWELKRQEVMTQAWLAKDDPEDFARAMQAVQQFNASLTESTQPLAITNQSLKSSFQQRAKGKALREAGMPTDKRLVPLYQEVQSQHPDAAVSVEKTR